MDIIIYGDVDQTPSSGAKWIVEGYSIYVDSRRDGGRVERLMPIFCLYII